MKKIFSILSVLILFFISCKNKGAVSNKNLSFIYKKESGNLHPLYTVYHSKDNSSELHFKVSAKELLYTKKPTSSVFTANILLSYKLTDNIDPKEIADSSSIMITDIYSDKPDKDIVGKIEIHAKTFGTYFLEVNITDMNRNETTKSFINIDKSSYLCRQNFLVMNEKEVPLFRNYISEKESFFVRLSKPSPSGKLFVRYYNRKFPMPYEPFALANPQQFDYAADSTFSIPLNDRVTPELIFPKQGFYHIQTDTTSKEGLTIFRFGNNFPEMNTPKRMIEPLRYLTTVDEYERLRDYPNAKISVDSFWLTCSGSVERGKEIIKKYYNRVFDANKYFSSYVEGWRSDRGMIYITYGPPNILYKNPDSETWVYGEENNINSLSFAFIKVINPFTDNDLRLERSPVYKSSWIRTIDFWRQGRIMGDN